ncbi:uncharacterized protein LOC133532142 isoform X2 [Cydia pomonella]|uniref:uncharacterized protein LOC133532142 isoform X2 n=1 Tax=Cydia pomonella TaxID=82600 RepID=UPI002ADE6990|nr:uncharacterized protein LOC133532142 isoform X2 [Cydia pomonella]
MGSRWALALPLCCLVGLFFIDTVNGSAEVTASRRNGAPSSPQDNRLRRIPAAKKNHYRINVKTGSFEVVDGDNDDTELARAQRRGGDVVTGSMEVVDGARNGTKICFSGDGYAYCKSDRDGQRSSNPDVRGGQNSKFGRQLPRRWPGQRNNTLPKKSLQELAEEAANRTANVNVVRPSSRIRKIRKNIPKKSLKELAEEAGNRTATGSDRLKNTSPRQNSVPSFQNIQSSKRSLEELQKLAKEAANRTPSVNAVRPSSRIRKIRKNIPKKTLQDVMEEAANRTANDITTGIPSDGGVNHATPAPAHNVQLPRSWRTLEDLFVNSRKPRSTSELSTGSWAIVSGNNTATVTSVSGFENQIRNNIKNN